MLCFLYTVSEKLFGLTVLDKQFSVQFRLHKMKHTLQRFKLTLPSVPNVSNEIFK